MTPGGVNVTSHNDESNDNDVGTGAVTAETAETGGVNVDESNDNDVGTDAVGIGQNDLYVLCIYFYSFIMLI